MKKIICALLLVVWSAVAFAQTRLEIRLAEDRPAAGLTEAAVDRSERKVYLHEGSVIGNADVVDARVVVGPDTPAVSIAISLTPEAAARMESATRNHQGRPLAILVNGKVVSAPTLRGVIRQDATIFGYFTRQEAEEIATALTAR